MPRSRLKQNQFNSRMILKLQITTSTTTTTTMGLMAKNGTLGNCQKVGQSWSTNFIPVHFDEVKYVCIKSAGFIVLAAVFFKLFGFNLEKFKTIQMYPPLTRFVRRGKRSKKKKGVVLLRRCIAYVPLYLDITNSSAT